MYSQEPNNSVNFKSSLIKFYQMKKLFHLSILFFSLSCFSQPGTLDTGFATGGKLLISLGQTAVATAVSTQPDGKILVAGYNSNFAQVGNVCIRLNANGSFDNSFGNAGIAIVPIGGFADEVTDMAVQADGKIILVGQTASLANIYYQGSTMRLNANGTLDTTFGESGINILAFESGKPSNINAVKIDQSSGKIVVGGQSFTTNDTSAPAIARFNINGFLDPTFNGNGIRLLGVGSNDSQFRLNVEDLTVQPNGKISAVGWRESPTNSELSDHWAARVNANGTLDTTFSTDGVAFYQGSFNGYDRSYAMLLKPDNTFVVAGQASGSGTSTRFSIYEITANGVLDSSSNQALVSFGLNLNAAAFSLAQSTDGKYIMAGATDAFGFGDFGIASLNPDYTPTSTFGTGGKVTTSFGSTPFGTPIDSQARDVAIQADNKIVAVGYAGDQIAVIRYNGNLLATSQFDKKHLATIYPNPASKILHVKGDFAEISNYRILDVKGRILGNGNVLGSDMEIDVAYLPSGLYVLQIPSKGSVIKFIKQ